MAIEIRAIAEGDIEGFRDALDSVAKEKRYLARFAAPHMDRVKEFVTEGILANVSQFVAVDDGRIVGWADVFPEQAEAVKHCGSLGMGVVEEYRGQGIGSRLLVACLEKAHRNGITRIELRVRADNQNAIALYKKTGFQTEGVLRFDMLVDGTFYDTLLMGLVAQDAGMQG